MDRETLFRPRDRWVTEPTPTHARLSRLTVAEQDLYEDLVSDRLGERVVSAGLDCSAFGIDRTLGQASRHSRRA
jgi:hypothetical protein